MLKEKWLRAEGWWLQCGEHQQQCAGLLRAAEVLLMFHSSDRRLQPVMTTMMTIGIITIWTMFLTLMATLSSISITLSVSTI